MLHLRCIVPDQAYDFLQAFMGQWMAVEMSLQLIRGDRDAVLVERVEQFCKPSGDGPEVNWFRWVHSNFVTKRSRNGGAISTHAKLPRWQDEPAVQPAYASA
jgi:hypothetical protein